MTPSEFQAWFPSGEFGSLDEDYVQVFIDRAEPAFDVGRWDTWYSEGLAHYVAHSIVVDKARAAQALQVDAGNVTEKHVGPVGASFDSQLLNRQARDTFMTTSYGRRYCELRNKIGLGGVVVR